MADCKHHNPEPLQWEHLTPIRLFCRECESFGVRCEAGAADGETEGILWHGPQSREALHREVIKLRFMIDNGLDWVDMHPDGADGGPPCDFTTLLRQAKDERDALRTENDKLRIEVEDLKTGFCDELATAGAEMDTLRAENERLQADVATLLALKSQAWEAYHRTEKALTKAYLMLDEHGLEPFDTSQSPAYLRLRVRKQRRELDRHEAMNRAEARYLRDWCKVSDERNQAQARVAELEAEVQQLQAAIDTIRDRADWDHWVEIWETLQFPDEGEGPPEHEQVIERIRALHDEAQRLQDRCRALESEVQRLNAMEMRIELVGGAGPGVEQPGVIDRPGQSIVGPESAPPVATTAQREAEASVALDHQEIHSCGPYCPCQRGEGVDR
ncbi:MAG: hypothetical protein AB7S38_28780 [Vulcanimicrobiota bacterium]